MQVSTVGLLGATLWPTQVFSSLFLLAPLLGRAPPCYVALGRSALLPPALPCFRLERIARPVSFAFCFPLRPPQGHPPHLCLVRCFPAGFFLCVSSRLKLIKTF